MRCPQCMSYKKVWEVYELILKMEKKWREEVLLISSLMFIISSTEISEDRELKRHILMAIMWHKCVPCERVSMTWCHCGPCHSHHVYLPTCSESMNPDKWIRHGHLDCRRPDYNATVDIMWQLLGTFCRQHGALWLQRHTGKHSIMLSSW